MAEDEIEARSVAMGLGGTRNEMSPRSSGCRHVISMPAVLVDELNSGGLIQQVVATIHHANTAQSPFLARME